MYEVIFSRGHATLELAVSVCWSVGWSVTFLNCERYWHFSPCPTKCEFIFCYTAPAHPSATGGECIRPCLVVDTQLYERLCPFVGLSVSRSVEVIELRKSKNAQFRPCPPVRNWWPCIRPCFFKERKRSGARSPFFTIFVCLQS